MKNKDFDVNRKLTAFIKDHYIKQSELAHASGMTSSAISSIVNDKRNIKAHELKSICDALKITTDELFQYKA